jgi:hypothetical protein
MFFGPIYALINLFIYILQNPHNPRIQSDLAAMDIGAGFFARLQVATDSELSVQFAKEMAVLAHKVLERGGSRDCENQNCSDPTGFPRHLREMATSDVSRSDLEDHLPPFDINAVSFFLSCHCPTATVRSDNVIANHVSKGMYEQPLRSRNRALEHFPARFLR